MGMGEVGANPARSRHCGGRSLEYHSARPGKVKQHQTERSAPPSQETYPDINRSTFCGGVRKPYSLSIPSCLRSPDNPSGPPRLRCGRSSRAAPSAPVLDPLGARISGARSSCCAQHRRQGRRPTRRRLVFAALDEGRYQLEVGAGIPDAHHRSMFVAGSQVAATSCCRWDRSSRASQ